MYFDHVRCPSCGAQFDPEKIENRGGAAACPACGGQLDIRSLFGVAAHLDEADAPNANIDDLVEGYGASGKAWRTTHGYDPLADQGPGPDRREQRVRHGGPADPRGPAHSTGLVRSPGPDDDDAPQSDASAVLRALRDLKKR